MERTINLNAARKDLNDLVGGLDMLVDQIIEDHGGKGPAPCAATNFMEFQNRHVPKSHLIRAKERLSKKTYTVSVCGVYSAGKSTLINSLLGEPDFLSIAAGECTLTITLVRNPDPGVSEHAEVKYFSSEAALKLIFTNSRYTRIFAKYKDDLIANFSETKAKTTVKAAIENAMAAYKDDPDFGTIQKSCKELADFLHALEEFSNWLGKTNTNVRLEDLGKYLTFEWDAATQSLRGFGHIMLIETVTVFKNMPAMRSLGVEFVDTPGIDSVNDRQRQITIDFINQSDALLILIDPKGLDRSAKDLWTTLSSQCNDIKSKVFIVMNKFDKNSVADMTKDSLERGYKAQLMADMRTFGLSTDKLFFVSALREELNLRKKKGKLNDKQARDQQASNDWCDRVRQAVPGDLDPTLKRLILGVASGESGAMDTFRDALIEYLDYEIQYDRLKEVYIDAARAYDAVKYLLSPEEPKYRALSNNRETMGREVTEFFEKAKDAFIDEVAVIPRAVEKVVVMGMDKVRKELDSNIKALIKNYSFNRDLARNPNAMVKDIKLNAIEKFKTMLSTKFAEVIQNFIPPLIKSKVREQADKSKVNIVIDKISEQLGMNYGERYKRLMDEFDGELDRFTYMRCLESTWGLQDAQIDLAGGFEREWDDKIEEDFRGQLLELFLGQYMSYIGDLSTIIGRHYKYMIMDLITNFEKLVGELFEECRKDPKAVALPMGLLSGAEEDEEAKKNRRLVEYFKQYESCSMLRAGLAKMFGNTGN
ncbi:MAG: dynamin family protein [Planctomycetota bacterium]